MRRMLIIALLMLPSACASIGDVSPIQPRHAILGAMNAPDVLEARVTPRVKAPALRDILKDAAKDSDSWQARVEYRNRIDRPDLIAKASRNIDNSRPAYATVRRSFGTGEFRPYLGVGVGQTTSRFDAAPSGGDEGFVISGVVGGDLRFTDEIGGYVQYDYAVANENPALSSDRESHGLRLGLSISLN